MVLTFLDETGLNPVAPGVQVAIYALGADTTQDSNILASGMLGVGGTVTTSLPGNQFFTAIFTGTQAPGSPQAFQSDPAGMATTIVVAGYQSPNSSAAGYTAEMRAVPPVVKIFVDDPEFPVVTPILTASGAVLGAIDTEAQIERTMVRIQSCTGTYIDSFFRDLFGFNLPRIVNETDANYVARGMVLMGRLRLTLAAIQTYVDAYLLSTANLPPQTVGLGEDTQGGEDNPLGGNEDVVPLGSPAGTSNNFGEDVSVGFENSQDGGEDIAAPPAAIATAYVFDLQSDPVTAAELSTVPGEICILFKYQGYNQTPKRCDPYAQDLDQLLRIAIKPAGNPIFYATVKY